MLIYLLFGNKNTMARTENITLLTEQSSLLSYFLCCDVLVVVEVVCVDTTEPVSLLSTTVATVHGLDCVCTVCVAVSNTSDAATVVVVSTAVKHCWRSLSFFVSRSIRTAAVRAPGEVEELRDTGWAEVPRGRLGEL